MSTWSVFPETGPPTAVIFSSSTGVVTRADIERMTRAERARLAHGAAHAGQGHGQDAQKQVSHHQPALFLAELLAAWSLGRVLVLEAGGRRVRGGAPAPAAGSGIDLDFRFQSAQSLVDLYTSGTTGRPECHTKTARQLLGEAEVLGPLLGLGPGSVVLSTVSLHHLYGLLFGLLAPLRAGACIVSDDAGDPARFHPHRVGTAVREYGVTHLMTIPAHLRSILDADVHLSGLREVVSSAAALPAAWARQVEERSGARVVDVLGSTESGGIALSRPAREASYRPLPGVLVRASTDDHLQVLSPFAGQDEPLETGDRVRVLDDGTFVHLGRDDGVVKLAGKRFSLQELEQAALDVPEVSDAVAFARPKAGARGTEIWLVVGSETLGRGALRVELSRRVDPVLMPRRVRILPRLPRDARGKVPRAALERCLLLPGFELLELSWSPFRLKVRLREDAARLAGHFPGAPVLPAVAQLLDLVLPEVERMAGASVVEARRLKWQAPVLPGDTIVLTVEPASPCAGQAPSSDYRFRLTTATGAIVSSGILATTKSVTGPH